MRSRLSPPAVLCLALIAGVLTRADAETGYDLWLRYVPVESAAEQAGYRQAFSAMVAQDPSPTGRVVRAELQRGLRGLLGSAPAASELGWDYRMKSGLTLWAELVHEYSEGAYAAGQLEGRWKVLRGRIDDERHLAVLEKLHRQAEDAAAWRDKCLRYFGQFAPKARSPGDE